MRFELQPTASDYLKNNLIILVGKTFSYGEKTYKIQEVTPRKDMVCKGSDGLVMKFSLRSMITMMESNLARWETTIQNLMEN